MLPLHGAPVGCLRARGPPASLAGERLLLLLLLLHRSNSRHIGPLYVVLKTTNASDLQGGPPGSRGPPRVSAK